jgi:hypothetical protein
VHYKNISRTEKETKNIFFILYEEIQQSLNFNGKMDERKNEKTKVKFSMEFLILTSIYDLYAPLT